MANRNTIKETAAAYKKLSETEKSYVSGLMTGIAMARGEQNKKSEADQKQKGA